MTVLDQTEKTKLVFTDVQVAVKLANHPNLSAYQPSKQLCSVLSLAEIASVLEFLWREGYLGKVEIVGSSGARDPAVYAIWTDGLDWVPPFFEENEVEEVEYPLLGAKTSVPELLALDPVKSILWVKGVEIKLGRGNLEKTIQYFTCVYCLKSPNLPVSEGVILEAYRQDYSDVAGNRAIRDAVNRIESKILAKTGVPGLFSYSAGYATLHEEKLHS